MKGLISVIVPVYNTEKYLDRCIQSILSQTYSNIEILLIDDGSTDSSGAICDKYAEQDSRVRVFHKANGGASTARNMGLDNAKGEWIAFVDSDDWIDAEMYEKMYALAECELVDAVYCDMIMEQAQLQTVNTYINDIEDHQLMYDCLAPIGVVYFSMCNKLISRRIFDEHRIRAVEGANMWEDVELAVKVRYYVNSSRVINQPYYHYNRLNDTSTTREKLHKLIEGQVERVKQIESFFLSQKDGRKYKHFVALMKYDAKKRLFEQDINKWVLVFQEAKWSLYKLSKVFGKKTVIKYFMASFLGSVGIYIIQQARKRNILK